MKKTLIAMAALAATGAFAQSSVTLYGRLSVGYGNQVTSESQANTTGNPTERELRAIGGANNGWQTSYWGIKGSEDLGGGLKANFTLEQDVAVASGTVGTGFNRISTVGLEGGFGKVDIGRFYTPFFQVVSTADVNNTSAITTMNVTSYNIANGGGTAPTVDTISGRLTGSNLAAANTTVGGDVRGNGIHYVSPNFSGFTVRAMVAPADSTVAVSGTGVTTSDRGQLTNNGLSADYTNGPLKVGVAWGEQVLKLSGATTEGRGTGQTVAATYDFGAAKLFAAWAKAKRQANTSVETYSELTETNLGVAVPFGKTTFTAAWGRNTATSVATGAENASLSGNDWILGVGYDLSKRTLVFAKTGVFNNYDGNIAGLAATTKTTNFTVGVRHLF